MYIRHGVQYNPANEIDEMRSLLAHELYHTATWPLVPNACPGGIGGQGCTYALTEDLRWWMEATATWAQPKVHPQDGSYVLGLSPVLVTKPFTRLTSHFPFFADDKAYGSFILATYLEKKIARQQNPANAAVIVLQVWQYFHDHGGDIVTAIDQVLQQPEYNTSFREMFPEFAWTNYFLNAGTYTDQVRAFSNVNAVQGLVDGAEWELFRDRLGRVNPSIAGVGVLNKPMLPNSQISGPGGSETRTIEHLGILYLEFVRDQNWPANTPANLSLSIRLVGAASLQDAANRPRVSVIAIQPNTFAVSPHQPNFFVAPNLTNEDLIYETTINGFDDMDRIAVIISNFAGFDLSPDSGFPIFYTYEAQVLPP